MKGLNVQRLLREGRLHPWKPEQAKVIEAELARLEAMESAEAPDLRILYKAKAEAHKEEEKNLEKILKEAQADGVVTMEELELIVTAKNDTPIDEEGIDKIDTRIELVTDEETVEKHENDVKEDAKALEEFRKAKLGETKEEPKKKKEEEVKEEDIKDDKDAMVKILEMKGVAVDKRWGKERLKQEIESLTQS